MQHSPQSHSLESILHTSLDNMQRLYQALLKEISELQKNNVESLEDITAEKIALTQQIEQNESRRIEFLTQRGLDPSKPKEWLHNKTLNSLWNEIKSISEEAQKQNQINGVVINGNRHRVQTTIEILSSSPPAVELVYTSTGENIKQQSSTPLARA